MAELLKPLVFKAGQLVRNERFRRWGQILWDVKKYQCETGEFGWIRVWCVESRSADNWEVADLSMVVERGKIIHEAPDKVSHFDRLRSGADEPGVLANVAAEAAEFSPIVAKMCAILDRVNPGWHEMDNKAPSREWERQIERRRVGRERSGRTLDGVVHDGENQ